MPPGEPDLSESLEVPEEGHPPPDRLQACRRTGAYYVVIGVPVLLLFCVLSALTDNWTWLLYASPIVVLCLALALVLLLKRPDEPDEPDEPDDGAGRAAPSAIHLRR